MGQSMDRKDAFNIVMADSHMVGAPDINSGLSASEVRISVNLCQSMDDDPAILANYQTAAAKQPPPAIDTDVGDTIRDGHGRTYRIYAMTRSIKVNVTRGDGNSSSRGTACGGWALLTVERAGEDISTGLVQDLAAFVYRH